MARSADHASTIEGREAIAGAAAQLVAADPVVQEAYDRLKALVDAGGGD